MKKAFILLVLGIFFNCESPVKPGEEVWELIDSDFCKYVFVVEETNTIFYGGNERNFRSSDGETWQACSVGCGADMLCFGGDGIILAVLYENCDYYSSADYFVRSKNNGLTWEPIVGQGIPKSITVNDYLQTGWSFAFLGSFGLKIYQGYPSGLSWVNSWVSGKRVISKPEEIYVISYTDLVVLSWDYVYQKWDTMYVMGGVNPSGIAKDPSGQVWVEVGYSLMHTLNGVEWETLTIDDAARNAMIGNALFAFYEDMIFVGHSGGLILSEDKGNTWKKDEEIPGGIGGIEIFQDYVYVASQEGLFRKKLD